MLYNKFCNKKIALSILAGILFGTSYIPFPPWAMFFCFVPLWIYWLEAKSIRDVFVSGFIMQFLLSLIGFNWVAQTIHEYGHLPMWLSLFGLLAFCSINALNIPIAGLIWFKLLRQAPRGAQIVGLVALTAVTERLWPMVFDFHLGYTWLWIRWPAFQIADVIGFFGLSTLTIAANGLILSAWLKWRSGTPFWRPVAALVIALISVTVLGVLRKSALPAPDAHAQILVVQANISNSDKEFAEHGGDTKPFIVDKFFELTSRALAETTIHPDFALWPETAYPDVLADPNLRIGYPYRLKQFVGSKNLNLVTGAYGISERRLSNALAAVSSRGVLIGTPYSKTHLLPFGEYLPGSDWFPQMKTWIPEIAGFGRGQGPQLFEFDGMKLGPQICYEGLFDSFARGLANLGAQIIVNSTNDSWYPDWNEPFQHLYMTLGRAIETRRPLIRATNTGISTAILADGEILERSPRGKEWTHVFDIAYLRNPPSPPFLTWGYYLFPAILGVTILLLVIGRIRNWRWN